MFSIFDHLLLNDNKEIEIGNYGTINLLKKAFNLSNSGLEPIMTRDYPGHDLRILGAIKRNWALKSK